MRLTFVLPFAGAAQGALSWACGEHQIDFEKDAHAAARCALAFAASKIAGRVNLSGEYVISWSHHIPPAGAFMAFEIKDCDSNSDALTLSQLGPVVDRIQALRNTRV